MISILILTYTVQQDAHLLNENLIKPVCNNFRYHIFIIVIYMTSWLKLKVNGSFARNEFRMNLLCY